MPEKDIYLLRKVIDGDVIAVSFTLAVLQEYFVREMTYVEAWAVNNEESRLVATLDELHARPKHKTDKNQKKLKEDV
jgi:hypothetical protein